MSRLKTKNIIKSFSKEPIDFGLLMIVLIMLALGIVMVMSASAPRSLAESGNSYKYVKSQATSAVLGMIAMIFMSKFDYRRFKPFYIAIYMGVLFLLASVAVMGSSDGRS